MHVAWCYRLPWLGTETHQQPFGSSWFLLGLVFWWHHLQCVGSLPHNLVLLPSMVHGGIVLGSLNRINSFTSMCHCSSTAWPELFVCDDEAFGVQGCCTFKKQTVFIFFPWRTSGTPKWWWHSWRSDETSKGFKWSWLIRLDLHHLGSWDTIIIARLPLD